MVIQSFQKINVEFLVLLVFVVLVLFLCIVSLLTALISLLKQSLYFSGHNLIQFLSCISGLVLLCFFRSSSPSRSAIDLFNFSAFYCFAVTICVRDIICSAFRSIT